MITNYYEFIDENTNPVLFSGWYEENGKIITNPPAEKILALGYKPIVEAEYPALESDQYVEVYWTEQDSTITKNYRVVTDDEITTNEALLIITGGEAI